MEKNVVFIFYKFNEGKKICHWEYKNLPGTWKTHGPGNVYSLGPHIDKDQYEYEEQFTGSYKYKNDFVSHIVKKFEHLKDAGILENYLCRS
jgi:hypothetical protein